MKKTLIFILIIGGFLSSCKRVSEEEMALQISLSPTAPYALPINMKTCKEQFENSDSSSVAPSAFEYNKFVFQWTGDTAFELVFLQLVYESQDLSTSPFTCIISDDNLDQTLFPQQREVPAGNTTAQTITAGCAVRCGGMKFKDTVKYSYIVGRATAFGIKVDDDGEVLPVEAIADAGVQYKKVGF